MRLKKQPLSFQQHQNKYIDKQAIAIDEKLKIYKLTDVVSVTNI